jgi:hypothetical protein
VSYGLLWDQSPHAARAPYPESSAIVTHLYRGDHRNGDQLCRRSQSVVSCCGDRAQVHTDRTEPAKCSTHDDGGSAGVLERHHTAETFTAAIGCAITQWVGTTLWYYYGVHP